MNGHTYTLYIKRNYIHCINRQRHIDRHRETEGETGRQEAIGLIHSAVTSKTKRDSVYSCRQDLAVDDADRLSDVDGDVDRSPITKPIVSNSLCFSQRHVNDVIEQ